jgi:heme A synthase
MENEPGGRNLKLILIGSSIAAVVVLALIVWGLYSLGGADQAPLERLRDIAVIFVILLFLLTVALLAGIVAALVYLAFQIKDEVIPLLHEATSTARVVRSTTEFMSEEAVKPVIDAVGAYARLRGMMNAVKPKKR